MGGHQSAFLTPSQSWCPSFMNELPPETPPGGSVEDATGDNRDRLFLTERELRKQLEQCRKLPGEPVASVTGVDTKNSSLHGIETSTPGTTQHSIRMIQ